MQDLVGISGRGLYPNTSEHAASLHKAFTVARSNFKIVTQNFMHAYETPSCLPTHFSPIGTLLQ